MKKTFTKLTVFAIIVLTTFACNTPHTNDRRFVEETEEIVEDLPKFPFINFGGVGEIKIGSSISDIASKSSFYDEIIINKIYSATLGDHFVYLSENELERYKDYAEVHDELLEGIVKNGNDTMIIFRSSDSYTIDEIMIYSPHLRFENGIGVGIGINDLCSNYDGSILSTDSWAGEHAICFDIHNFPDNVVLYLSENAGSDFFDWEGEYVMPKGGELIRKVNSIPIYRISKSLVENSYIEYIRIGKDGKVNEFRPKKSSSKSSVINKEIQQQKTYKENNDIGFKSKKDVFEYCKNKHFTNMNGTSIQISEYGITFSKIIGGNNIVLRISTFGPFYSNEIKVDIYSKSVALLKFRDYNNEGWEAVLNSQNGTIEFGWAGMHDFPFRDYVPNFDMFYLE